MNNDMWQACPVCKGQGVVPDMISLGTKVCHVCNGHGIISVVSGTPPQHPKYTSTNTTTIVTENQLRTTKRNK